MAESLQSYGPEIQELFLRFLVTDDQLFARTRNIIDPHYFTRKLQPAVEFMMEYSHNHNAVPELEEIRAVSGVELERLDRVFTADQTNWFLDTFEIFCKHKALELAVIESADYLKEENHGAVKEAIDAASKVGLVKDLGLDYFDDPKARLESIRDKSNMTSTGWKSVDNVLYGGFNRGEMTIFCGKSGEGKSLFLQNLGLNWTFAGLNVVYISLELSEPLISLRLDAMTTGRPTKEIMKNMDDTALAVAARGKKAGKYRIKQMPSLINVNDIYSFIREYEIDSGIKVDAILIDYLDLMAPTNKRISLTDAFAKDKFVSEEIRNLAIDLDILCVTASQFNRSAVEEMEYDHSHIAGGISKINTADNVIGIFTSSAMKERGRYQIQFMKTRSSAGTGRFVDLKFDQNTLRIEDLDPEDEDTNTAVASTLLKDMQRSSVVSPSAAEEKKSSMMQMAAFLKNRS